MIIWSKEGKGASVEPLVFYEDNKLYIRGKKIAFKS